MLRVGGEAQFPFAVKAFVVAVLGAFAVKCAFGVEDDDVFGFHAVGDHQAGDGGVGGTGTVEYGLVASGDPRFRQLCIDIGGS